MTKHWDDQTHARLSTAITKHSDDRTPRSQSTWIPDHMDTRTHAWPKHMHDQAPWSQSTQMTKRVYVLRWLTCHETTIASVFETDRDSCPSSLSIDDKRSINALLCAIISSFYPYARKYACNKFVRENKMYKMNNVKAKICYVNKLNTVRFPWWSSGIDGQWNWSITVTKGPN